VSRQIYLIVWRDAYSAPDADWKDLVEDMAAPIEDLLVHSVGYLGREDARYVELISTMFADETSYCNPMKIPKSCIVSRTLLKPRKRA
jgi:hypothetical protein